MAGFWRTAGAGFQDLGIGVLEFFGMGDAARELSDFRNDADLANEYKTKLEAKVNEAIAKAGYDRDKVYNSLYKLRNSPLRGKQLQEAIKKAVKRADTKYSNAVKKTAPIQAKISEIDRDVLSGKPSQVMKYDKYWGSEHTDKLNKLIEKEI